MPLEGDEIELLERGISTLGIGKSQSILDKFARFIEELLLWNKKTNLVGSSTPVDIIVRHVLDSLTVYHLLKGEKGSILDLGAGAGFPSIPLKIVDDDLKITIVEKRRKRVAFLRNIEVILGLKNLSILEGDIRNLKSLYDVILARGVGELKLLYELTKRVRKESSMIIAFKGKMAEIEKEMSRLREKRTGDKDISFHVHRVQVPHLDEEERNIVVIEMK